MAFRKKAEFILNKQPDIIIVPESEHPNKLVFPKNIQAPNDVFWLGDNPNKGLGVFSYSDLKIKVLDIHNPEFRYVVPLSIKDENIEFILLAVWCQKPSDSDNYGIHTWNAINYYKQMLKSEKVILAGDFNSSSIWDKPRCEANHSNIVSELRSLKIESTYHYYSTDKQGFELCPTLHMHRKIEKPYHIDFCFASDYFIHQLKNVEIGIHAEWSKYSDHNPIIVDFEI